MAKRTKTTLTNEHKKALAAGREEGRVVRNYLHALESNRPKRGRKRTPDSIKRRLAKIERELADASSVQRLQLVQERMDLSNELERMTSADKTQDLEKRFLKVAKAYSARKGISYAAWRELGVPAEVLRRAGITRSG